MNNNIILESINGALAIIAAQKLHRSSFGLGARRALKETLIFIEVSENLEDLKEYVIDKHIDKQFEIYKKTKKCDIEYLKGQVKGYENVLNMINTQIRLEGGMV